MVAGLDTPGIPAPAGAYLATFTYKVPETATGELLIEVMSPAAGGRTFLFPTPPNGKIEVLDEKPLRLAVLSALARDHKQLQDRP
jgi:hypothetical protein